MGKYEAYTDIVDRHNILPYSMGILFHTPSTNRTTTCQPKYKCSPLTTSKTSLTQYFSFLIQVRLRTEVPSTPSSTRLGFKLMTSRSWQYISCYWDVCSNHLAISDFSRPWICFWLFVYWSSCPLSSGTPLMNILHLLSNLPSAGLG